MHRDTRSLVLILSRALERGGIGDLDRAETEQARRLLEENGADLLAIHCYALRHRSQPAGSGFHWRNDIFAMFATADFATLCEAKLAEPRSLMDRMGRGAAIVGREVIHAGAYRHDVTLHPDGFDATRNHRTNGILLAMTHPIDEPRYEAWYVPVHLEDERRHGQHHTITRFMNLDAGVRPRSLSILEAEQDDISHMRADILDRYFADWSYPPGIKDTFEVIFTAECQSISQAPGA